MEQVHVTLTDIVNNCIPIRSRKINPKHLRKEPWLIAGIKLSLDKNKKLYA